MLRTSITVTAVALTGLLTLAACGPARMGAAAITGNQGISTATLSQEVASLKAAYQQDKSRIQLQFPVSQTSQQVLSWLVRFRVRDRLAAREGIKVSRADAARALAAASAQAKQGGVTLRDLAVANGLPPDMLSQFGTYQAIQNAIVNRMDGGTLPKSNSALQALSAKLDLAQCRAAKSLNIQINPQFGRMDYRQLAVIPATSTLSAPQSPSPSPTGTAAPQLKPSC